MPEWFEEWFGEEYLQLYPHRDQAEADRAVALVARAHAVLAAGMAGARRRLRGRAATPAPSARPAPRCVGLDLSAHAAPRRPRGHRRAAGPGRHAPPPDPSRAAWISPSISSPASGTSSTTRSTRRAARDGRDPPARRLVRDRLSECRGGARAAGAARSACARRSGEVDIARTSRPTAGTSARRSVTPDRPAISSSGCGSSSRQQLGGMLARRRGRGRHRFGDYDAAPLRAGSPRTILVGSVA